MPDAVMTDRMVVSDVMAVAVAVAVVARTAGGGRGAERGADQGDCDEGLQAGADHAHGVSFIGLDVLPVVTRQDPIGAQIRGVDRDFDVRRADGPAARE